MVQAIRLPQPREERKRMYVSAQHAAEHYIKLWLMLGTPQGQDHSWLLHKIEMGNKQYAPTSQNSMRMRPHHASCPHDPPLDEFADLSIVFKAAAMRLKNQTYSRYHKQHFKDLGKSKWWIWQDYVADNAQLCDDAKAVQSDGFAQLRGARACKRVHNNLVSEGLIDAPYIDHKVVVRWSKFVSGVIEEELARRELYIRNAIKREER